MISKIVTDYLRDLALRLGPVADAQLHESILDSVIDHGDVKQLIDLADTLDEDRKEEEAAAAELQELIKGAIRDTAS